MNDVYIAPEGNSMTLAATAATAANLDSYFTTADLGAFQFTTNSMPDMSTLVQYGASSLPDAFTALAIADLATEVDFDHSATSNNPAPAFTTSQGSPANFVDPLANAMAEADLRRQADLAMKTSITDDALHGLADAGEQIMRQAEDTVAKVLGIADEMPATQSSEALAPAGV
ncbi:hypothetical protein OAO01_02365 [Oligoflexia bacterium]|nr:hypothetical protein [Oligoflexia bacterium]